MNTERKVILVIIGILVFSWCAYTVGAQESNTGLLSDTQTLVLVIGVAAIIIALLTAGGIICHT